ncbi:kelch repeat-containing protein [Winogradskyella sp. PG-2]|uniref:Kelch repeat-containing protein n=1 Tax=Winogradskyella sp. PG-2 TaxID=754409 RepID=UPI0004585E7A|nr:kelch repeat-containing protein [Winogradskyella sp. PG-2]BAO75527.1 hypothetical protein WPG_1297 [Winogradskyella sp. PG-2]
MKTKPLFMLLSLLALTICCDSESSVDSNNNPDSFNLLFINDNATDIILTPILTWQPAIDSDDDTVSYQLLIDKIDDLSGNEAPSTVLQSNINTNTVTLTSPLMAGTAYKWCVIATDGRGGSRKSSSVFSFTTAQEGSQTNLPPNMFSLLSPGFGATNVSLDPQLSWQAATDPDNDPVFYDIYFGESSPDNFIGQTQNTSFQVNQLSEDTEYLWYVLAKDIAGNVRSSSTFSFTTCDGNPGPISLLSSEVMQNRDGFAGHQMVNYNGKLWILGGLVISPDVNGETNEVWTSDDNGETWELIKPNSPGSTECFVASDEHQAVVFNNEIWVIEGNRNTVRKSTDGITWEFVSFSGAVADNTHYLPRNQHQCAVLNGRLYIVGGSGKSDVWSTDGSLNSENEVTWVQNKPNDNSAFSGRNGHQLIAFEGELFLIGGTTGNTRLNDVWASSDGSNWQEIVDSPFSERSEHSCIVDNSGVVPKIWLIGGDGINPNTGNTVASLNDIWYTEEGLFWEEYKPHIDDDSGDDEFTGRKESEAVLTDSGEILVSGGKKNTIFLNDIWKLDL